MCRECGCKATFFTQVGAPYAFHTCFIAERPVGVECIVPEDMGKISVVLQEGFPELWNMTEVNEQLVVRYNHLIDHRPHEFRH